MALTKVKLIADGTIVQSHLNASHGITTADIGENASYLYYTDARARAAVSVSGNALSYNSSTGVITSNFEESPTFTGNVVINGTTNSGRLFVEQSGADMIDMTRTSVGTYRLAISTSDKFSIYDVGAASDRLVIDTSGNVGIGTTNPQENLHIADPSDGIPVFRLEGSSRAYQQYVSGTSFYIRDVTGSSNRITLDSSGNVGIGIASPRNITNHTSLTINGTSVGRVDLAYGGTISASLYSNNSATGLQTESALPLVFGTDETERMRIDSSGDLYIGGTTDYGGKINIEQGGSANGIVLNNTDSTPPRLYLRDAGGASYSEISANNNLYLNASAIGIGTTSPGYKLDVTNVGADAINVNASNDFTGIRWSSDQHTYSWRVGGDVFFIYDVVNSAQRVTLDASGNLGIGKTSPDTKLHIKSSTYDDFIKLERDGVGAMGISATNPRGIQTTDGAGAFLGWHVNSSGNVGIGTFSPGYTFTVAKSITNDWIGLINNTYDGAGNGLLIDAGNGSSGEILRLRDRNGNSKVSFLSNGNVGIGQTNPQSKLQVGTRGTSSALSLGLTDGILFDFYNDGPPYKRHGVIISQAADASESVLDFNTKAASGTNSTKMTILGNGNVGIGNAAPGHKLDVYQDRIALTGLSAGGSGHYIALSGQLPGYAANVYNCLETNLTDLHFAAGGVYTGYISYNSGFTDVSDISLKENIEDIPDALNKVNNLRGRYFTWKNELQGNNKQIGFIAQEVEEYIPEAVTSGAGGTKGIAYGKITALLVNAIKELKADNDNLRARIEILENN